MQSGDEDNKTMLINFALALALVYLVMAALFESLIHRWPLSFPSRLLWWV